MLRPDDFNHGLPSSPLPRQARRSRAGFTFLELTVVLVVLLVALLIFASTIEGVTGLRGMNRERALAVEAARSQIEVMRNQEFRDVFAMYNANPADDPDGAGTAPGSRFLVAGLDPRPDVADGMHGEIRFPTAVTGGIPEIREDLANGDFGTPRDLNADSIIDDASHSDDYFLLPVRVQVRWRGKTGNREVAIMTALCDVRKEE